jgi:flagella basal body P-ring formation protein FlgA
MMAKRFLPLLVLIILFATSGALAGGAWRLDLPAEAHVSGIQVQLKDLVTSPVPAAQGDVIILGQGEPGSLVTVDRRTILRKLVESGLAAGVIFGGAQSVTVHYEGSLIKSEDLRLAIRREVQPLVPLGQPGAPASHFDLHLPETTLPVTSDIQIEVLRNNPLVPGRNQVRVRVKSGGARQDLPVMVLLHAFGQVPTAQTSIKRETPLTPDLFTWQWLDLAEVAGQPITSQSQLLGNCAGRTLPAGDRLRLADLKPMPAIHAGDQVELQIQRGTLMVSVKALARQAGCLGQTIPVRNELNGRLVNARVTGPGQVEWRR